MVSDDAARHIPATYPMAVCCSGPLGTISGMAAFATPVSPLNRPMHNRMDRAIAKVGEKPNPIENTRQDQSPIRITALRPILSDSAPQ